MAKFNDFNNPRVAALPAHLKQFIVDQKYEHYTPVDQAVWRYVMRQNYSYLKDVAYYPYIPGLKKAGLTIERIPDLQEMNDALGKIGWGAVTVDGFIPPAAFMEYQAYRVLVIAADIRQLKHIEYTPAPDIIHESAGHAPIIAEKDYHEYLSYFGSIGAKAMFSARDFDLYEAIRSLSILKEMPDASASEIREAEQLVAYCQQNLGEPSEMALLSRLHWWTVEYGLIGSPENPKIYGAGLLSSIGESVSCMRQEVKKLWYTIDAINYPYDITQPQPQLFVTPDFQTLIHVLDAFANTMSFRVGGQSGLKKAIECKNTCTIVYNSGLQISGTVTETLLSEAGDPYYIKISGPAALAYDDKELDGHGKIRHKDGYGSPVGKLSAYDKLLEDFKISELKDIGVELKKIAVLEFESGIRVTGKVENILTFEGKIQLITFSNCTVDGKGGETLFEPRGGAYDMAVGSKITSVFCGAADKGAFDEVIYKSSRQTYHPQYDSSTLALHQIYQEVRNIRQGRNDKQLLPRLFEQIQKDHGDDWLCAIEILEILDHENVFPETATVIKAFLNHKIQTSPELSKLITDGLHLIHHPIGQG